MLSRTGLTLRAYWELLRHDLIHHFLGFEYVCRKVTRQRVASRTKSTPKAICEAVSLASCLYWKPVYCLQRAAATTRMLRLRGIPAELVIGYRPSPFTSHAWVEVDGCVINDSPAYKERMLVLHKL